MRLTLFTLLFLSSIIIFADNIIIGKVLDIKTNTPLIGVNIIYGKNSGTITDEKGNFKFITTENNLLITFKYIGYSTLNKSIKFQDRDTIYLEITMEENINELDEIVISAGKTEQKVSELTVSLDIIKPEVITRNHTTNLSDIITNIPGIEILDGQPSIRGGSGYSYGAGSRVLVLIDGLPVLSADAGDVKWGFLPIENLSQIEIIKGASSVLYGSSALNGIINLRTNQLLTKPILKFSISSGIYDKPRNHSWIWNKSPLTFSNISFYYGKKVNNSEYGIGTNLITDKGYRKFDDNNSGKINFHIKHKSKLLSSLIYGMNLNSSFTKHQDFILWENADSGALIQDESSVLELKSLVLAVDPFFIIKSNEYSNHEIKTRFQTTQNHYLKNINNNSDAYSFYIEYKYWRKLIHNLDVTSGFSQQFSNVVSNFYSNHNGYNIAGYSQIEFHPVEKLNLVAGVRLEQFSLDNKLDELIPIFRTGLNYKLADFTFLRASYGQGYRYPSIAEKYGNTKVGSIKIFPNPEIKSESGWSAEVGLKQGIHIKKLNGQIDLSIFNSQNKDLIEYVFGIYPDPVTQIPEFGFQATNIENARIYGFELEIMLNKNIGDLSVNIGNGSTFIYPIEFNQISNKTTQKYLKYRNKYTNKTTLNVGWRKFSNGINLKYKSKMLRIDNVFLHPDTREMFLPGFYEYWQENNNGTFILDYNLNYNITSTSNISLSIKNLLNSENMGRPGDILPQRSFSLQYLYHY